MKISVCLVALIVIAAMNSTCAAEEPTRIKPRLIIAGQEGAPVEAVAFSPGSKVIASSTSESVPVLAWDAKSKKQDLITVDENQAASAVKGRELVEKSRTIYRKRAQGRFTVSGAGSFDHAGRPVTPTESFEGTVWFRSPDSLRIEFSDSNGDRILLLCEKGTVTEKWENDIPGGAADVPTTLRDALAKHAGSSRQLTLWLPAILTGVEWERDSIFLPKGDLLKAFGTDADFKEVVKIEGRKCARIVCKRSIATWELYLDSDDYSVHRLVISADAAQMAEQKKHGGGGRSGDIQGFTTTYNFRLDSAELGDDVFSAKQFLTKSRPTE